MYLLNELHHDILPKLQLNCWQPKNNGLLRKKNTKELILKKKGTKMAEDGAD